MTLLRCLLAIALVGCAAQLHAQQKLVTQDAELGAEAVQFALGTWRGRAAITALTRRDRDADSTKPPALALQVVRVDEQGWGVAHSWPLPPETRHVEPMRLPGGAQGWLLLVGTQWQIALPQGAELERRALCPCDTIYSHGGAPDSAQQRFAHDLDGDGADEVVLPYSGHLEAYRIAQGMLAPQPIWRAPWHDDGTPLPRHDNPEAGFRMPAFDFPDVDGDGRPELFITHSDAVRVARLPAPGDEQEIGLDASRRALLARRTRRRGFPQSLQQALERVGDQRYASTAAFLNALGNQVPREQQQDWPAHMLSVLALARSVADLKPYTLPLAGLGTIRPGEDRALLLGHTDMDGDGVLDVLHAKLIEYGSVLSQKNELRWYRGRIEKGRLAFAPPANALRTDAGSFAELARPRTDNRAPLALLMATTEVSFSSVMRALAAGSVTLRAQVLPWQKGALAQQPVAAAEFTYKDLKADGRRAMFLFADLDGDGWRDYLLNLSPDALTVFLSAGKRPTLQKAALVAPRLPMPSRPERVIIADMDGDGREDLVLRYREEYHGQLGRKLRLVRLPAPP